MVSNLLEARDQIVLLPTGAGKSLCFQLASQLLPGVTVVAVPLLALLEDQLRQCGKAGLRVGALRGGQSGVERRRLAAELAEGAVRLVYATPEALVQERAAEVFAGVAVAALVVDEAHCIAEWGPSFRPAYRRLGDAAERLGAGTRAAFTATAGAGALAEIRRSLFAGRPAYVVSAEADRPNLRYRVLSVLSKDRALEGLVRTQPRPLVVFCRSRSGAEQSARLLRRRLGDQRVYFYHAGLDAGERAAVERWFLGSRDGVLTATSAYGMGVDKPDIHTVVHRDLPLSPEAYLQEVGRAGRDGRRVQATLLLGEEDRRYAGSLSDPVERRRYLQVLRYAEESGSCRRRTLLGFLGQDIGSCAGCDVCDAARAPAAGGPGGPPGGAPESPPGDPPEGQQEILAVVRRHGRRLTRRELNLLLAGAWGHDTARRGLERLAGFGALAAWRLEDVEAAVETLQRAGLLRMGRGFWQDRVVATAEGHSSWRLMNSSTSGIPPWRIR